MLGFKADLLPADDRYWGEIDYRPRWTFEAAARKALEEELWGPGLRGVAGKFEETMVHLVSPKVSSSVPRKPR